MLATDHPFYNETKEFLEMTSSRLNADILADKIEGDTDLFGVVWYIMLNDTHRVAMRAAWALSIFVEKHPYFIEPWIPQMVNTLADLKSDSVRRSLLKIFTLVPLPKEQSGLLFDICFNIVESPSSGIAHKAYAISILYNISEMEPGLKPELIALFESQLDGESAGVLARCSIFIKKLRKDLGVN